MTVSVSRALQGAVLDTGAFNSVFDLCFLKIWTGSAPTNADSSLPDAEAAATGTLLATFTVDGDGSTGLGWEASADDNILAKDSTETWKVLAADITDGTAGYFRYVLTGDDNSASTTYKRIQGVCGTVTGDMLLANLTFSSSVDRTVENAYVGIISAA